MHDLQEFLTEVRAAGVELWVRNGWLRYRAPNGVDDAVLDGIRRRKAAIIAYFEPDGRRADVEAKDAAAPPLSYAQEGLWLIDQINPGSAAYNLPAVWRLKGALDMSALVGGLRDLEVRHEILRTRYPAIDGIPVQDILDPGALDLDVIDLAGWGQDASAEAERRIQRDADAGFDCGTRSPFRVRLMRLSDRDHILMVNLHHLAADGASFSILFDDLAEFYTARIEGRAPRRNPISFQYADFARTQRHKVEAGALRAQRHYWRARLKDAPKALDLPTDRSRRGQPSGDGSLVEFEWSTEYTDRILDRARQAKLTPFMLLLAAYQILLARWCGISDLCVGTPVAAYRTEAAEPSVGNFLNTLVMRGTPQPAKTVADFLSETRRDVLAAFQNCDFPFDRLVADLGPAGRGGGSPLFQTLFAFETGPAAGFELPGLGAEPILTDLHAAKFDLSLLMRLDGGVLAGGFEYAATLFDRSSIQWLTSALERIVSAIVASPEARIGDLPLLDAGERRRVLETWNRTALPLAEERTLTSLFLARMPADGQQTAVIHGSDQLSYAKLDRESNRFARYLRSMGVGPGDIVGIALPRRPDMVVSLLGVLKAGAAYLPLDPSYPAARLDFMISDCGARVVVGTSNLLGTLTDHGARTVCLDLDRERLAGFSGEAVPDPYRADSLAYVLYTSGSTGMPKAVMIEHRSVTALIGWAETVFSHEDLRCTLASTSICFDMSVFELFMPLMGGGTVLLVDNALSLAESPPTVAVTLINTVPSAARALLERGAIPVTVRTINLGGEPVPRAVVESLYAAAPEARILNLYGPSEDTTYSMWCHVRSAPKEVVGIGRPIGNTQVYLLDGTGEPVPAGRPGDLFLAGEGLARGYINRPATTAERFVPNPFGPPGSRMYATGDKARHRADGSLEFLGRTDHQVKVRGYRIEPGEIEACLDRIDEVGEAAVVIRESPLGDLDLVAHVVLRGSDKCDPEDLRSQLLKVLPAFMVPAGIEIRDRLPLTPNGKIDRQALAALPRQLASDSAHGRATHTRPLGASEILVARVWGEVLHLDAVGVDEDFFALGGHSILASRVIAKLGHQTGGSLTLGDLFEAPTVRQLAARLEARRRSSSCVLERLPEGEAAPASFAQERLWFIDQFTPGLSLYNISVAWRLEGVLRIEVLREALMAVKGRHEILRTTFRSTDGGPPVQVVSETSDVVLPVLDLSQISDPETAARAFLEEECQTPFDLANGPLFRASLAKLGGARHVLQLTSPHIIVDGWSLDILLRDLAAFYREFLIGEPASLPPLPVRYRDYAHWQRARMAGVELDRNVAFWRKQLQGVPKELRIDSDRPRPPTATFRGDTVSFILSDGLAKDLRELARTHSTTMFMLVSAVFAVLLFRYSRQRDFCIGYPVGIRDRIETEDLVGLLVNTLVMRIRPDPEMGFDEFLQQVRGTVLAADAHRDFPFERLVEELKPVRDPSHHPFFQVLCSYSKAGSPGGRRPGGFGAFRDLEVNLPGLELELVEIADPTAKFELSMFVTDRDDGLYVDLEYAADLFDRETVVRMARHIEKICRAAVLDPACPVGALDLIPWDERRQILVEWGASGPLKTRTSCLHSEFERQVQRTPDAAALEAGRDHLSYSELNARANRLARHLQALGVGPETLVGVLMARTADLVVGLLAILKAGGAYLPLDPAYPARRLAYMAEDSGAQFVLTTADDAAHLTGFSGRRVLIDRERAIIAAQPAGDFGLEVRPGHLAYCLYTSGSTGQPKAVALEHGSAVALLDWAGRVYSRDETARTLATTSICFDLSVFEIFLPLVTGGTVVLADDIAFAGAVRDPSLINTVPSSMKALAEVGAVPGSLKAINLAGEPLDPALVATLHETMPGARLFNLYGPTEATTYATFTELATGDRVTIGRPVDPASVYILDDRLEPVPTGVIGQLFVAGPCLARGYLGRPALTAERFFPDPFGPAGVRMYATGDRARFLADGRIEFRGRWDNQVKFRGNRIELGEVEIALLRCPGVKEAVAAVLKDGTGDDRLAAFVTLKDATETSAPALTQALKQVLPRSMIPRPLVIVERLAYLPNGKIDRGALRLGPDATGHCAPENAPPRTTTEILLAGIWRDLLGVAAIGINSSFFALGGHSMSAIQMSARVAQATGSVLPLREIFENTTIAELAARLDDGGLADGRDRFSPIPRIDRRQRLRAPANGARP
ncbi:amino acid adenylation domain-containing protein [Bradyrhizobium sp. AUGA SZCCT0274]|uniref:non-ribosomal peptide synthetase n=1 Tax=Bradyrhizobium sp. AUGA SZCCT0274 TaxID=2807670 RepID=UPI001BA7AB97|nr:non-ribosomal peptide synthetase [Bradyrhizobium sp. AUGA SZCCT0274]MBR1240318.1 amino acid adenylation domain-containing protein [Bradyrhizobium sp. AUGA SZCCT0274]